jgi:hypothetical protein
VTTFKLFFGDANGVFNKEAQAKEDLKLET